MTTNLRNWTPTGAVEVHDGIAYRQMVETGTSDYHEQWGAHDRRRVERLDARSARALWALPQRLMDLRGATIIDNALGGRRGTIISVRGDTKVLVLWPGGGYNEVDAAREPGRFSVLQP